MALQKQNKTLYSDYEDLKSKHGQCASTYLAQVAEEKTKKEAVQDELQLLKKAHAE